MPRLLVPFVCHDSWCAVWNFSVRFDHFFHHQVVTSSDVHVHHVRKNWQYMAVFISFNVSFNVAVKNPTKTMTINYRVVSYELWAHVCPTRPTFTSQLFTESGAPSKALCLARLHSTATVVPCAETWSETATSPQVHLHHHGRPGPVIFAAWVESRCWTWEELLELQLWLLLGVQSCHGQWHWTGPLDPLCNWKLGAKKRHAD